MREEHAVLDGDARPAADTRRRTDEVAESVDGADGGVLERTREKGARKMGRVMLDVVQPRRDVRLIEAHRRGACMGNVPHRQGIRRTIANERRAWPMTQREQP